MKTTNALAFLAYSSVMKKKVLIGLTPIVNVITLFSSKKVISFVHGKPFQPSLIFARKAVA